MSSTSGTNFFVRFCGVGTGGFFTAFEIIIFSRVDSCRIGGIGRLLSSMIAESFRISLTRFCISGFFTGDTLCIGSSRDDELGYCGQVVVGS